MKSFREPADNLDVPNLALQLLEHSDPYQPFLPLLAQSNVEDPIPLLTSSVLSQLISVAQTLQPKSTPETDVALSQLFKYLGRLTKSQDSGLQDISIQAYSVVLKIQKARQLFWTQRQETVTPLFDILRAAVGSKDSDSTLWSGATSIRSAEGTLSGGVGLQLLYHVLLVIWQLSYEGASIGPDLES